MTTMQIQTDEAIAHEVGARVHDLMWRKKISQARVGQAIGVSQSTTSKKIRGEVGITIPELLRIAQLLDVDVTDLLQIGRAHV